MDTKGRKWYQKKRYWLIGGILFLAVLAGSGSESSEVQNVSVVEQPTTITQEISNTTSLDLVGQENIKTESPQKTTTPSYNSGTNLSNNNYYINVDGNSVHSPAYAPSRPAGASARCRDGTYSFSQNRRGTCSRHGGVSTWY